MYNVHVPVQVKDEVHLNIRYISTRYFESSIIIKVAGK